MKRDLFGFVFAHTDNCERCLTANFCDEGKALMKRAVEIATECLLPGPLAKTPDAKA